MSDSTRSQRNSHVRENAELIGYDAATFDRLQAAYEFLHECIQRVSPRLRRSGTVSMIDTMAATTISRLNANAISAAWRTATLS